MTEKDTVAPVLVQKKLKANITAKQKNDKKIEYVLNINIQR